MFLGSSLEEGNVGGAHSCREQRFPTPAFSLECGV